MTEKYTYIFKSLSAQQYDSLVRCWCLKVLADNENTKIEFKLGKQYFAYNQEEVKVSEKISTQVQEIINLAGLNIHYTTTEEFMNDIKKADNTYLKFKKSDNIRNQLLFRNNIRKKGIATECIICGEDDTKLLEAAHLWEVKQIKKISLKEVNNFIKINKLQEMIEASSQYSGDFFYKKYFLANSGDNGVWVCSNHHKQFDLNYYYFDSKNGKVIFKFDNSATAEKFKKSLKGEQLSENILTPLTKAFLHKREELFK